MAVSFSPSPDRGAEMKLRKVIEELRSELQEHKQSYRNLEEKFLVCQSMTYTLVNQFQKYESGAEDKSGKEQELLAPRLRKAAHEEKEILRDSLDKEYHDNGGNDEEEAMDSSLNGELQEEKGNEFLLDEKYFLPSGHPDPSDSQELLRSSVFPSDEPEVSCAVDEASPTEKVCLQGPLSGRVSPNVSEVQASEAHLYLSAQMSSCQGTKLGHQFNCGDGVARLSLSSTINSCVGNTDSGKQWMLFPELNLDACTEMKNPPKVEGAALGVSAVKTPGCAVHVLTDATSVLTQKIMKRKPLFRKMRIACRFPGLQASENHEKKDDKGQDSLNSSLDGELQEEKENDLMLDEKYFLPTCHPNSSDSQELLRSSVFPSDEPEVSSAVDEYKLNLDASIPMKNLAKIEGDALKGSSDSTRGFQEHDATGVWKQKIIRRKLLFSKWRIACRFPGLQASEMDSDGLPGMNNSPKMKGDATDGSFTNKNGHHVIGHIDDYTALTEQTGEGKQLVQKILSLLRPTCNFLGLEAQSSEAPGNMCFHELRSSACALHHTLEESASLLTMFWRAALPSFRGPGLPGKVDESMERELLGLRAQVSKQEKLLQSTAERLKTANQQKENMEQFIVSQLTRTHDVLKKAKTNLDLRKWLHLTRSQSLLQIHHHLSSDL